MNQVLGRGSRPGKNSGFTLIEVFIAVGLLAMTAYIFATLFTHNAKSTVSTRVVGQRDAGFFKVGKHASDPAALLKAYQNSGDSLGPGPVLVVNPCLRACLSGVDGAVGCTGGTAARPCGSYDAGAFPRVPFWHELTLYDPDSGEAICGPHPTAAPANDPSARPVMRYTRAGALCEDSTLPDSYCPIQASCFHANVCPRNDDTCGRAHSVIVRYNFSWTTSTSVAREEIAALKNLSGEIDIPVWKILGSNIPFYAPDTQTAVLTNINTDTGTSTSTGATCGNNILESGEDCDDGGTSSGDGCSENCIDETACGCYGTDPCCGAGPADCGGDTPVLHSGCSWYCCPTADLCYFGGPPGPAPSCPGA